MKKFYAMATAVLAAVSMNAQMYVCGAGDGLKWEPENPMTVNLSGNAYTFTVDNLVSFKISNAKGSWDAFNGGAYSANITEECLGNPVELVQSDGNIETPWVGKYTVSVASDFSTITLTTDTPKPTGFTDVYLRGGWDASWAALPQWKMSTTDGKTYTFKCTGETVIPAGTTFKIADANWGSINYGRGGVVTFDKEETWNYNATDSKVASDFEGTITFVLPDVAKDPATVTFSTGVVDPDPEPDPENVPDALYIIGNVNGISWSTSSAIAMDKNDAVFSIKNVTVDDAGLGSGYFTFITTTGADWDAVNGSNRYGSPAADTPVTLGVAQEVRLYAEGVDASSATSWMIEAGKYDITVDIKALTMTVTKSAGVDPDPDPENVPDALYIIGNVNGISWSTSSAIAMDKNEEVFTINNVTVDDAGLGSGYFTFITTTGADWDAVNGSNRYGAPAADTPVTLGQAQNVKLYAVGVDASSAASWMVEAGKYDIAVDTKALTMTVTKSADGISAIEADDVAGAKYYNLQGVEVESPTAGLYIEVRGNNARKVLVK